MSLTRGKIIQLDNDPNTVDIWYRTCNIITNSVQVDSYIYFVKRMCNFTLWQYPLIRIFWPKTITKSENQLINAKKIEELQQKGIL